MNKKFKFAIPFAVLALSCGVAVGALTGCNGNHTHNYSDWAHNDTQHWRVCPDDGEIDESSKEDHVFVAGTCDCGATEKTGPVVQEKYGTVTGKVKLTKNGSAVTDNAALSSISVDMGDDKVEISGSAANGVYSFTVSNVKVGATYELTISCTGYKPYSTEIMLEEENEEAKIGGANGITLNYEVFGLLAGYDGSYHDFSQANDTDKCIKFLENDGSKTLNVLTKESYADVSASLKIKYHNSTHSYHTQGIVLKFEDGKHVIVRYHNGDQRNGNIQYVDNAWDPCKKEDTLFGKDAGLDQWGEGRIHTLVDAETAAIKADGLDLKVVLKGGTLYSFFDGKFIAKYALPDGYAQKKVQVGYFAWNAASNAEFHYDISATVPESMTTALDLKVTQPQDVTGCTVTATPEKETYEFGEQIELTFTAVEGYKLGTLTVGGEDQLKSVMNGKLTVTADRPSLEIVATYIAEEPIALNLTVKGKKLGATAALAEGTAVSFKGTDYTFTVGADGKITHAAIAKGSYTVVVEGYLEKEIEFNEELTEVTLEYDTFKDILGWGSFDFSKQNDATPEFGITNDCSAILTKDTYDTVKASIYLKGDNMNAGNAGIIFRFVGDGMNDVVTVRMEKTDKVQFEMTDLWASWTSHGSVMATGTDWQDLIFFTGDNADGKAEAYLEAYKAGTLKLSVVRNGATFYVFLGETFIGQRTFDSKYENAKCEVGFLSEELGNTSEWKRWKVEITEDATLPAVTITNGTAENANGTIEITEGVRLGDTVTVTVKPAAGYMLDQLTVSGGVTPTAGGNNTYTFIATEKTYTVTATFIEAPETEAEVAVTGIGLGAAAVDMNGKEIAFKPQSGSETKLTVSDGKVKGVLAAGEYTVSCEGFYDLTATVGANGSFAEGTSLAFEKIIFAYNLINEPEQNLNDKSNVGSSRTAASEGVIKATGDGRIYEWSQDQYQDVAITLTLKSGNGNQGMVMRFNGEQKDVRVRFENTKAQWIGGGWWWGTHHINDRWDFGNGNDYANPMSDALLAKYNGEGLTLTLVRKGGMVYALVDNTLYGAQSVSDYATSNVRLCVFVEDAKNGYSIPFMIEDPDTVLARAGVAVGMDLTAYGGTWTEEGATLKVAGSRGYAEFKPQANTVKESVKIKISKANAAGDQGIMYRFADGKYIAVRYQENGGNYKIQYTMDTLFFSDGSLKGWTDFMMTEEEKAMFDTSGLDLTFIRDGATFYVLLGDKVLDKSTLDAKYATMDGTMGIMIWDGKNAAFAYEHKTGDAVTIPEYYTVTASFDGAANGYGIKLDQNFVAKNGKVLVTVYSDPATLGWSSWSRFPAKITINGVETALTVADFVSDGANKLHCTKEITITADTEIKVTIAQGTIISKGVVVTVKDNVGGTVTSDSGEDGYYWNDACTLYITPAEGYEIASITVDGGEAITSGWTFNTSRNRYEYNIADPIQKAITIVVEFRAVTPAE